MARPIRIEFGGAVYHVTARGDRREPIFEGVADRERFLKILVDSDSYLLALARYVVLNSVRAGMVLPICDPVNLALLIPGSNKCHPGQVRMALTQAKLRDISAS